MYLYIQHCSLSHTLRSSPHVLALPALNKKESFVQLFLSGSRRT